LKAANAIILKTVYVLLQISTPTHIQGLLLQTQHQKVIVLDKRELHLWTTSWIWRP